MADINPISFGQTTDLLGNAVKGASLENDQISNNLANVNTPNYRRSTTNFREALQASLGMPGPTDELTLQTDSDRQFEIDGAQSPVPFNPQATVDQTIQMRVDQSNVDVDQEAALLSENAGYSQTMSQLLQEQYKFLREAITETTN
jgi:flagellar basal-body rod protein FlgB